MVALVTMSRKEIDRAGVVARIAERRLTQVHGAEMLGLSVRQMRRLCRLYEAQGAAGLVSKRRGKPSNRKHTDAFRDSVLAVVRQHYADFGPTLAQEKLLERHGLRVSVTTLRWWMAEDGLWVPRKLRDRRAYQPRRRRPCLGELVQIDGCDHEWFEDRGPRCVLLVFVDDATGRLMELRFALSGSTFEYFASVRRYLQRHGRPVAFYSDKASIFRVNKKEVSGDSLTQFRRAMQELNIDIICAHSAPAKGRVERAHLTLQDRLVKELRLAEISTMEEAQGFLDGFVEDYNRRFGQVPQSPQDAHRPLLEDMALDDIFKLQEARKVSRNLTLNYKRTLYVLEPTPEAQDLKGKRVQIYEDDDGQVSIRGPGGRELAARPFSKTPRAAVQPGDIVESKLLGGVLSSIRDHQLEEEKKRLETAKTRRERRLAQNRLRKASG